MSPQENGSWLHHLVGGLSPALLAIVAIVAALLLYLQRQDQARERVLVELVQACIQQPH